MKALLIPVKDPSRGKTRLATILSEEERRLLAWAMLLDVSNAAAQVKSCEGIFVVSSYEPALSHARSLDFDVIEEKAQQSESQSVDAASLSLAGRGFKTVMRLPADLPLVRSEDIEDLLAVKLAPPAALMVPSREGTGTNAILRTPPVVFPSRFGPNSLSLHISEAERAGARCVLEYNPRIALDIDEPCDLVEFISYRVDTHTLDSLHSMGAAARLKSVEEKAGV
ncbi:MAG: 2-phospho-L-lactate guanylyltransferase [Blastocatellia bacterium AA13]|nr:MAG: 2-phospho-L-lactate guanylyltransferase [Blastocatellia bacterium AA13]